MNPLQCKALFSQQRKEALGFYMRLTRIYTKKGDSGTTQLAHGERVPKDSIRIEAYGSVDELNSFIGLLRDRMSSFESKTNFGTLVKDLESIQHEMHDLGGELATKNPEQLHPKQSRVSQDDISRLEMQMDQFMQELKPLANFVLPGGHELNSLAHICRTICRRAERRIFTLSQVEPVRSEASAYINRLSDWFFVAGRYISYKLQVEETLWNQTSRTPQTGIPPLSGPT